MMKVANEGEEPEAFGTKEGTSIWVDRIAKKPRSFRCVDS